jgi:hypothetical protein
VWIGALGAVDDGVGDHGGAQHLPGPEPGRLGGDGAVVDVASFIGGPPSFIAQLNLGVVALAVNFVVMLGVSAATRRSAPPARREPCGRFERAGEGAKIES